MFSTQNRQHSFIDNMFHIATTKGKEHAACQLLLFSGNKYELNLNNVESYIYDLKISIKDWPSKMVYRIIVCMEEISN